MPPKRNPRAKRRNKRYRRAARRRSYAKHAAERRAQQNEKNARDRARELRLRLSKSPGSSRTAILDTTMSLVSALELRHPRLLWMGPDGVLHPEENLSAEQLLARWQQTHPS